MSGIMVGIRARPEPLPERLRVLSLFAGIGGFDLGLERTGGFKTVAFCEIDPFCRKVLEKHWPGVPCYEDVRSLTADRDQAQQFRDTVKGEDFDPRDRVGTKWHRGRGKKRDAGRARRGYW